MAEWNNFQTDSYEGMIAETISYKAHGGDLINAYFARPLGAGPFPGIVLIHHMPGWDELFREFARRFAHHGYVVICPNLYFRYGHGTPDDVTARMRAAGGVPDETVVGDCEAAMQYLRSLPYINGKIGITGTCSGGRNAYLTACRVPGGFQAVIDLWGGRVVAGPQELTPAQPVAPIDYTKDLSCPLLGLFGAEDQSPTPEQVKIHEEELKKHGKNYEFHMYEGAGHAFFYHDRGAYRQAQAMDGWEKVFAFFGTHLKG